MKKLVIFDMDGLLLDTESIHDWSWKEAFNHFDLDISTEKRHTLMGLGHSHYMTQIRKIIGDDKLAEEVREVQRNLYHGHYNENKPNIKKGAIELLEALKELGVKLAVATSTREASATKSLKRVGLYDYFDYHNYGDRVSETKPNPALYNKVVEDMNIDKKDALILEDSYHGIKAANNAEIDVIWIKDFIDHSDKKDINYLNGFESLADAHETIIKLVK